MTTIQTNENTVTTITDKSTLQRVGSAAIGAAAVGSVSIAALTGLGTAADVVDENVVENFAEGIKRGLDDAIKAVVDATNDLLPGEETAAKLILGTSAIAAVSAAEIKGSKEWKVKVEESRAVANVDGPSLSA